MPRDFQSRLSIRAENVVRNTELLVERSVNAAGASLVRATPVDTGLARSNWVARVGARPDLSDREIRSPEATIDEIESIARRGKLGPVSIANGGDKIPYLRPLNDGSSRQAPAGFIRQASVAAVSAVFGITLLSRPQRRR